MKHVLKLLLLVPLAASSAQVDLKAQDVANCEAEEVDRDRIVQCVEGQSQARARLDSLWQKVHERPEVPAVWQNCLRDKPGIIAGHNWDKVHGCVKYLLAKARAGRESKERQYGYKKEVDGDIIWHVYGTRAYSNQGHLCNRPDLDAEWKCE